MLTQEHLTETTHQEMAEAVLRQVSLLQYHIQTTRHINQIQVASVRKMLESLDPDLKMEGVLETDIHHHSITLT